MSVATAAVGMEGMGGGVCVVPVLDLPKYMLKAQITHRDVQSDMHLLSSLLGHEPC